MKAVAARKRIQIQGVVQGVGFRPFVYRVAQALGVGGYVLNSSEGVVIEAEADEETLQRFITALPAELPPLARIDSLAVTDLDPLGAESFVIRSSTPIAGRFALAPPDVATCAECLEDFTRAGDRRFGYPFTNCTNCGPRYTIIRDVPYDRAETTMDVFRMCAACQAEYDDPGNRRFHAEPNACPECGPSLALLSADQMAEKVEPHFGTGFIADAQRLLEQGEILAIKGLGGFHLACDASNDRAVGLLRERKRRSGKAFAIMLRDLASADRLCHITEAERAMLLSAPRPIVLLLRRPDAKISSHVAPGNTRLGVMLPYTPLHHLLFVDAGFVALVMTSGNLSEEPIVSRNQEAWPRLQGLADHFLLHNREIQTRVDDSVVAVSVVMFQLES